MMFIGLDLLTLQIGRVIGKDQQTTVVRNRIQSLRPGTRLCIDYKQIDIHTFYGKQIDIHTFYGVSGRKGWPTGRARDGWLPKDSAGATSAAQRSVRRR